jgi:hypothetical protein
MEGTTGEETNPASGDGRMGAIIVKVRSRMALNKDKGVILSNTPPSNHCSPSASTGCIQSGKSNALLSSFTLRLLLP